MTKRYRKKPVVIEAIQLTETNHTDCIEFITGNPDSYNRGSRK